MASFGMTFKAARAGFFDRAKVIAAMDRANLRNLSRAGSFVRTSARSSLRYRTKPSRPGEPPSVHRTLNRKKTNKKGQTKVQRVSPLREFLFFSYDRRSESVVIGPARFEGKAGKVPRTLELGGAAEQRPNLRRTHRVIGESGEIRIGEGKRNKDGVLVSYTLIRTQLQAERANRLNEQLYGPATIPAKNVQPRPFMGPALRRELPKMPRLWANSVR